MISNAFFWSIGGAHVLLIGANAATVITVTRVTCKSERDPGLSIFESDKVLFLGKVHKAQGTQVPRNLVLATLTSILAYLPSFGAA